MRFGDVEVLVEAIPVAGTEPTSALDKAADEVVDVLGRARSAVRSVAESMVGVIHDLAGSRVAKPDKVEVELGLGFSVKGNVIVVSGAAQATLKVTLTYNPAPPAPAEEG
ncbi:MAG: CU044_2847 family protein [Sciscionella sp.]